MKASTLKLCLPIIAMTAQQSATALVIPPFLDGLKFPVATIGSLVSVAPIFALAARLPSGLAYRGERARILMVAALLILTSCSVLYSFVEIPLHFALIHALTGLGQGTVTTIYLAFYVEALPPDEDRHHAMGYYAGCLAIGYSAGGFVGGYVADRLGYAAAFQFSAFLGLLCLAMLFLIRQPSLATSRPHKTDGTTNLRESLKGLVHPKIATVVVVALFLNLIHQMGSVFLPLYALAVGLTLTQVGVIKGLYALCNAVTRPMSGFAVKWLGHRTLSHFGLPLQSAFLMLVPFFHDLGPLLVVFVLAGFLRAVVIVSNTISMVQDVNQTRVSRGVASGIFNAAGDLGNILGPSLGGLIASVTGVARLFLVGPFLIALFFLISLWTCKFVSPKK